MWSTMVSQNWAGTPSFASHAAWNCLSSCGFKRLDIMPGSVIPPLPYPRGSGMDHICGNHALLRDTGRDGRTCGNRVLFGNNPEPDSHTGDDIGLNGCRSGGP